MKNLLIVLFFLPLALMAQAPTEDLFTLSEGTNLSWQTTSTDFESLLGEVKLSSMNRISYSQTNNGFFYINGSPTGGENMTFVDESGKTVTLWLSTFTTTWVKCPDGECTYYKGKHAGVTTGHLIKS